MNLVNPNTSTSRLFYIAFAFVASILYDVFLWNEQRGLGFVIFTVLFITGFLLLTSNTEQLHRKTALWLLLPITILSLSTMIYTNDLVSMYVPFVVTALMVVMMVWSTVRNPENHPFSFWNIPVVRNIDYPFAKWGQIFRDVFARGESKDHNENYRKIAIGVAISAPILFLFAALFAGADDIFAQWIEKVLTIQPEFLWRIVRTGIFTMFLGGLLYVILSEDHKLANLTRAVGKIDSVIISTVLTLVNILFLIFVSIQIRYLFGSSDFVVTNGLTFANYARHGFFELAWVMVFSLGLMTVVYRSLAHHGHSTVATVLKVLLAIQVEVIAFSALTRMNLYQGEYGFTTLRLYVEWFIYFIMGILAALSISMVTRTTFKQVFYGAAIAGIAAFAVVASLNVDGIIAERNIDRYKQGKNLDVYYLLTLSPDVYPAVAELFITQPDMNRIQGYTASNTSILQISSSYVQVLRVLDTKEKDLKSKYNSWREMNFGAQKALQALQELPEPPAEVQSYRQDVKAPADITRPVMGR